MENYLSDQELSSIREKGKGFLGKRIVLDNIRVPNNEFVPEVMLTTRGKSALVVSQVDVYSHLVHGTPYKKRFDNGSYEPGDSFVFPVQGGIPNVSIVLAEQRDAIAVIKQVMSESGEDLSWKAALERLGVDRSQYKDLIEILTAINTTRSDAALRLEEIPGMANVEYDLEENPKPAIRNLDSTLKLSRLARTRLKSVLLDLLTAETAAIAQAQNH